MSEPKLSHQHQEYVNPSMVSKPGMDHAINHVMTIDTINTLMASRPPQALGDPTPLGLAGFALTTFILALINLQTQGIKVPNIIIGPAFAYGGVIQFAAGMWEIAVGNTFGATASASYGGFWVSFAIILTPAFGVSSAYSSPQEFNIGLGIFLMSWFIFNVLLTLRTMKSTIAFFTLLCLVDVAFLMLGIAHLLADHTGEPHPQLTKAGGVFALLASFNAWYIMYASVATKKNSFVRVPLLHFPWGEHGAKAEDIQNEGKSRV